LNAALTLKGTVDVDAGSKLHTGIVAVSVKHSLLYAPIFENVDPFFQHRSGSVQQWN